MIGQFLRRGIVHRGVDRHPQGNPAVHAQIPLLADQAMDLLQADGFRVYLPSALPCNDAALSFGQAAELAARDNNG